jgi:hypothetical protein
MTLTQERVKQARKAIRQPPQTHHYQFEEEEKKEPAKKKHHAPASISHNLEPTQDGMASLGGSGAPDKYYKKFDFFYKRTCFRLMAEFYKLLFQPF